MLKQSSDTGFQVSSFKFQVSSFKFQISSFKFLLMVCAIAIFCQIPATVHAIRINPDDDDAKRVIVLPFDVHSEGDTSYLQNRLTEILGKHLKQEGAVLIDPKTVPNLQRLKRSIKGIRKIGIMTRADFVVWGSLTRIGQKFSLDAKMISSVGKEPPGAFFVQGESIENLPVIVKELSGNFGMKIFKREKVARVLVAGNKRIETDAIKRVIKTRPGNVYLVKSLSRDLKSIYSMGYFDDIRIEAEESPKGKIITFKVKEKPTIRMVSLKGNKVFEEKEIREDALTIKTGSILNVFKIKENINRIESLYKDKNYHGVLVTHELRELSNNQVDLEFVIKEGQKIRIKTITITGISAYDEKKLKKIMKTSEKGFWSWLTSSGELNKDVLSQDVMRLTGFYHNNGYIQARVGDPRLRYEGEWIYIDIKIDEGPRFKVGKVNIKGDLIQSEEDLVKQLKITREEYCNREVLRKDVITLTDIYSDKGYAFADIGPDLKKNMAEQEVDITYSIKKNKEVYFEKIIITGNTKTRDKIIRRELWVHEQELYSGRKLKRSVRNLYRLDYFEDVKVDTLKGTSDDKMLLKIGVTEKSTGTFSFGGGYSSVDDFFATASVTERNVLGKGWILQLKAELGGSANRYTLSFTEPWMFDIPLSAGFDVYNWDREYDEYKQNTKGGGLRFGYPVYDYTRLYFSYSYEIKDISDIDPEASDLVREMEGKNVTSSVSSTLRYDSRDRMFNPTEGSDHSFTLEYAGLGGDIAFTKYTLELGQYFPLFWDTVGFLHAKGGYVRKGSGGKLPDDERFYLGGMNSLRGFDWRDICSYDDDGAKIGGAKFVQFNVEYLVPLIKKAGLVGLVFFDTGNVYDESESVDLGSMRKTAGFGFRWYSPMAPIRIENGYILDPKEGESGGGRWEFTIGGAF
ncbi:MAG: outer membrane protein assembly factor BamA [Desulfobacterales bacterium]|nr:outer membrane protein assembly factor BamA [Desulfobacterales bacterium]